MALHASDAPPACTGARLAAPGARWFLLAFLLAIYPLALRLPESLSWENGWLERTQLAMLIIGFLCAAWMRSDLRRGTSDPRAPSTRQTVLRLSLIAMAFWLMCAGRETSWGATFLTRGVMEADGPYFSSSKLWYHMAIKPLVLLAVGAAALAFVYWRLDRPLLALMRQRRFPWAELALVVTAAVMSTLSESSMFFEDSAPEALRMLVEELAEMGCYFGLLLMQTRLFIALGAPSGADAD